MKRILLLYISNNSGHHRAAKAVEAALTILSPETKVMNINCLNYTNPVMGKVINTTYNNVIKLKPEVWEYLYDNPKVMNRMRKIRKFIHKFNSKKLKKLIDDVRPDLVACSQAFPCGMVADFKKTYNLDVPLVGILTDFSPHSYWLYDNVDAYIVPSAQSKQKFIESGIKKNKMFTYGIPVNPEFSTKYSRLTVLKNLKLEKDIPTILIMGGGQGLGPIEDLMFALNTIELPFQVIVVCGTNKKLKKWLEKRKLLFRKKMAVFGYSNEIAMLMHISDILVTKPGGLTTAEALAKGLPIIIVNPIPGQEAKNTEFLLKAKAAEKAKNSLDAAMLIEDLLKNPVKLNKLKLAAKKCAMPQSAFKIAEFMLKIIK